MRIFTNLLFLLLFIEFSWTQSNIADARTYDLGDTVTVTGIVTNGSELGPIRYLQDASAGIAAYAPGNFANQTNRGTEVTVTGILKDFNGLLELDPVLSYTINSSGNPLPAPRIISPNQINENLEGLLLQINGVTFADGGGVFSSTTYTITVNGQSTLIYLRANHPLLGSTIPLAAVNVTGILSEFRGVYQLLPRDADDFNIADAFFFESAPSQHNITSTGFSLRWNTNAAGSTAVNYGTDPSNLDQFLDLMTTSTEHEIELTGLQAATFYYVQAVSERNGTTIQSPVQIFSTASNSSGQIAVYFNHSVDARVSNGPRPDGTSSAAIEAAIIERIDQATQQIDVAMYNTNRTALVAALNAAHNRGVQVRFVTNIGSANLALSNPSPDFRVLAGNPDALMHNKFLAIDPDSETNSWLIMGSMNFTVQNMADDFNNMMFIQDQSLTKTFELEFEEMWGGKTAVPGIFAAKFGASKSNNTPHQFVVNGTPIEAYFSPSDQTTLAIENALRTAHTDLEFCVLSFTRDDLGNAIVDAHDHQVNVRGMIENIGDQGSEFQFLQNEGVNVLQHAATYDLHHKYAIIDATAPMSDPTVVNGSHNWSTSAETRNDESTLIIHSEAIANIFLQEFEQRWCEVTDPGNCLSNIFNKANRNSLEFSFYPNPAKDLLVIQAPQNIRGNLVLSIFNQQGQLLHATTLRTHDLKNYSLPPLPSGNYWMSMDDGQSYGVRKLIKL